MKLAHAAPVLMYHHVSPAPGLVTVSPATFRAQMAWLAAHGYRSAGTQELAAFLAGAPLPDKSVVITFDDGYLDNYLYAHPVLQEFGFRAVLFLITGWLGEGAPRLPVKVGDGDTATAAAPAIYSHRACMEKVAAGQADEVMLRWSEVAAMQAAGTFEFHSHTHSHSRWDRLVNDPHERRLRLADDLAASRAALRAHLGGVSGHLCWPQGYFDADYQAVAQAAGFSHLYTTEKGTCTGATLTNRIPRVVVKDRADGWFGRRLWLYRHPALTRAYLGLRGDERVAAT
ncbi:MAG: polysaccharide deacetylase family protein [Rugosibacter sp.]